MKDIIPAKKQSPILGLSGMGGGVGGNLGGSLDAKTYVDDVFSTYVYRGNGSTRNINNGLDLSTKGGMVWFKSRANTYGHRLVDTVRGATKVLESYDPNAEATESTGLTAFNNNGFTVGSKAHYNGNGYDMASWSFRKTPGFFDVVKYTGNDVRGRQIAHSLECKPGLILIKNLDSGGQDWCVYHSSESATKYGRLNSTAAWGTATVTRFNDTEPTATHFTLGEDSEVNGNGAEYIAYLFGGAGGAGVSVGAATNQNDGYIRIPSYNVADLTLDGDFTIEIFMKKNGGSYDYMYTIGDSATATGFQLYFSGQNLMFYGGTANGTHSSFTVKSGVNDNKWHHIVATRSGTTLKFYVDGILENTTTGASVATISGDIVTGENYSTGASGQGTPGRMATNISNFRITKGQVLYVGEGGSGNGNFGIPTDELTTTSQGAIESNVKLLCFQSTTVTAATKSPVTLVHENSAGNVTATTDTTLPFIDPETYIFGEDGDKNVVKCGSYTTDANEDATLDLGWEPQWLLAKRTDGTSDWMLIDAIRGFPNDSDVQANDSGQCKVIAADDHVAENNTSRIGIRPNGFYADQYGANRSFVYIAIRRPDGYVGKPASAGTDVFAMDAGPSSGTGFPVFESGFPVDFGLMKNISNVQDWYPGARLIQGRYLEANTTSGGGGNNEWVFDFSDGWNRDASSFNISNCQSWMWKRHAGFDVVCYRGLSAPKNIPHSLGKTPEMYWIKKRATEDWMVYHVGMNEGSSPEGWSLNLNNTNMQDNSGGSFWYAPTSTHLRLKSGGGVNFSGYSYIAMLWSSVEGISKCGYYTGTGTDNTISLGFSPRFIIIRRTDAAGNWAVFDTLRGITSGNDEYLGLNQSNSQDSSLNFVNISGNSMILKNSYSTSNVSGGKYIYYAHA